MHLDFHIPPLPTTLDDALRRKIDAKTKPLGALGRLEQLALQVGRVQGTASPVLCRPQVLVFAGDHGIAHEGVSAYPQEVTWQMVMNFLAGGAAVNVFARTLGLAVQVVDAGVNHDFAPYPALVDAKVARGTRNCVLEPAMTPAQCDEALQRGAALVRQARDAGSNVLAFGEMGIANTSAAALLLHTLHGVPLEVATGRGTGVDDAGLAHKRAVLARAAARTGVHTGTTLSPLRALAEYGGFEIAMMTGALLAAAEARLLVLVDGFIASSALLVACGLHPGVREVCVFAHRSAEAGHQAMLAALQAPAPLLDLDLRLGEGTGAVLAYPLLQAAVAFLNDMASFESAGVSERGVNFLQHEARLFFTALQFFTRVPVPAWVGWSPTQLNASARYFPLVGVVVGAVAGGVFEAARLLWPGPAGMPIAVLLSMAASVLLTGAFHEDGFADSCDGFGGGGTDRAKVLAIMKDSRVGSYAVVGLLLLLALKFEALRALPAERFVAVSIASHALSRAAALCLMAWLPYVREDALSKSKPIAQGVGGAGLVFGVLTSAMAAAWLGGAALAAGAACAGVVLLAWRYLRVRLGGHVGDALGATQQLAEVACLLAVLAWWGAP